MRRGMTQARAVALAIAILAPAQFIAADASRLTKAFNDKATRTIDLRPGGMLWIDNAIGSIIITGGSDKVVVETLRSLRAVDDATLQALKKKASIVVEGTTDSRIVKSVGLVSSATALARVDYIVKVPTATALNILSGVAEQVSVSGISGKLYIRNWRGKVIVENVTGPIQIDTVNTYVQASFSKPPAAGALLTSVNGNIEIRVPQASKFEWYAETMKGDILAGFAAKGRVMDRAGQRTFHSSINGGGSAAIRASSITGSVYLMPLENENALAASVLPQAAAPAQPPSPTAVNEDVGGVYRSVVASLLVVPPSARVFEVRKGRVAGNYDFAAELGENVFVGEVEGFARIVAGGGEVVLGRVAGDCKVASQGGPINLGEIGGALDAKTLAGDITVGNAKKGGRVYTGGGSVAVRRAAGPLTLESNGGDVIVFESSNRVSATTPSGDVRVRLDSKGATEPSDLKTGRGNVILEIPKNAKVTIDATITMDAAGVYRFESEFPGLTVVRERLGDGMRVHATGRVNGGGALMTINVNSGNVVLRHAPDKIVAPASRR